MFQLQQMGLTWSSTVSVLMQGVTTVADADKAIETAIRWIKHAEEQGSPEAETMGMELESMYLHRQYLEMEEDKKKEATEEVAEETKESTSEDEKSSEDK